MYVDEHYVQAQVVFYSVYVHVRKENSDFSDNIISFLVHLSYREPFVYNMMRQNKSIVAEKMYRTTVCYKTRKNI